MGRGGVLYSVFSIQYSDVSANNVMRLLQERGQCGPVVSARGVEFINGHPASGVENHGT